jgi:dTDP-D-glucose 4,6-dehydratase
LVYLTLVLFKDNPRFSFWYGNVTNADLVHDLMHRVDHVVHFAAESHVARSIYDNSLFFVTDVLGTQTIANELLKWHILHWGAENGYRVYDFGGAGKPDEPYGVRDFKAKFGGELVNFGRNICIHAPTRLKLSQAGYRLFRQYL